MCRILYFLPEKSHGFFYNARRSLYAYARSIYNKMVVACIAPAPAGILQAMIGTSAVYLFDTLLCRFFVQMVAVADATDGKFFAACDKYMECVGIVAEYVVGQPAYNDTRTF